jgi:hypothetical protein
MLGVLLFQSTVKLLPDKVCELTVYKCKNKKHMLYFHCLLGDKMVDVFLDKDGNWRELSNEPTELAEFIGRKIETKGK